MNAMEKLGAMGRKNLVHNFVSLDNGTPFGCSGWDDELEFNTQRSSQWDSLVHYHHQPTKKAYNGADASLSALESAVTTEDNPLPTLDHWHARGCLVGRGVLIDFGRYADEVGVEGYHPMGGYRITVEEVEKVAHHFGVEFRPGDILLVRTGFTEMVNEIETTEGGTPTGGYQLSGLHGTVDTARWLWNKRFAAAASDSAGFEAFPPLKSDGRSSCLEPRSWTLHWELDSIADSDAWEVLHEYMLSLFGMPIGELWDLKLLSEECKNAGRYSFMITSTPLNVAGLVASPPNAIAIL
jgi:kynurenine formamidase